MRGTGYELLCNERVESDKLELQGRGENLEAIINALPLRAVRRVLDVGCGSGFLTRALARVLGPECEVCGLDVSPEHILCAREAAHKQELPNIRYFQRDIFDPLHELANGFDLVYEKYVLMSMTPRGLGGTFLSRLKDCARAGGRVVCIEADINFGQDRYPPPPEELSKILPKVVAYYRQQGLIEWRCGVEVYHRMKAIGFSKLEIKLADGRIIAGGVPEELVEHDSIDVEQLLRPVLDSMNRPELAGIIARQWHEYLSDPESFIYTPIFMGIGTVG